MDFYEAVAKRRTVREFLDKDVDIQTIKRILEAGNKAPTWNHNRNWSYIILRTDEEKEYAFEHLKKIADKFDVEKVSERPKTLSNDTRTENVRAHHAETVQHAENSPLCHHSGMQSKGSEWKICFKSKSVLHHLVRDRKYIPCGNGRGLGLFDENSPERRT